MRRQALLLLLIAFLATSCAKEDAVSPCSSEASDQGSAKTIGTQDSTIPNGEWNGISGTSRPVDPDGTGISDDGDDLSNNEKSRKKRR